MKKENNNILYTIIGVLVLIIIAGLSYFLAQNNKTVDNNENNENTQVNNNEKNTPLVVEAGKIGLDTNKLNKCIKENKFLDKINSQMKTGADTFGISGTPGNVLINNETGDYVVISGAYPKEAFITNIDALSGTNNSDSQEKKTFNKNIKDDEILIISDKRDFNTPIDSLINSLKEIPKLKDKKFINYDFSDNGVKEFLKENNINTLPLILFTKNKVDSNIDKFLTKLDKDNLYSLNIGAKFNPFDYKGFNKVDKETLEKIKKNSYIDGDKNAKITWLEYSDLECPFCQKLHNSDVEFSLKEKYGKDLNIIFNHFPLGFHQKAIPGANILECVGEQGGNEAFYKILKYAYKNRIQE